MQRFAIIMGVLALLAGIVSQAVAQSSEDTTLTIETTPEDLTCATDGSTILTLDLSRWSTYTFFWVGTEVSPENLSLEYCDSAGTELVDEGASAVISRDGLELDDEVDGFRAVENLGGVSVQLSAPNGVLTPGEYILRHWIFERDVEERIYLFPEGHAAVTACGNGTSDSNGVQVILYSDEANEFAGNVHVDALAICEKDGLSYVNPATPAEGLRAADGVVYVFEANAVAQAAAQADGASGFTTTGPVTVSGPAFTVTAYTPGAILYPGQTETSTDEETTDEETTDEEQTGSVGTTGQHFALLGSLGALYKVTLDDGTAAVEVHSVNSNGSSAFLLRVDQSQVDAVDSGLVAATNDNRLIVKVSTHDIITFSMGPDDEGKVYNIEMDEGLDGPVSGTSVTRGGPPGDAYS